MKYLSKVLVIAAFLAIGGFATVTPQAGATAASCKAVAVGTKNSAGKSGSIFTIKGNKVSASYKVSGPKGCKIAMQLISWQAPNATTGRPYSAQKEIGRVVKTTGSGTYTLTGKLPDCYYQIDLVSKGSQAYSVRNIGYLHGGTHKCGEQTKKPTKPTTPPCKHKTPTPTKPPVKKPCPPKTPTPPTPTKPRTPSKPAPKVNQPKELPNTGPVSGAAVGTVLSISSLSTVAHRFVSRKRRA